MRLRILALFFTLTSALSYADPAPTFSINTNGFLDKGIMPVLYTCDGKNVSPQLNWVDAPSNTKTFALILTDKDAPTQPFYHWLLYNLPAKTINLDEGVTKAPAGSSMGKNSFGNIAYNGPCPPKGTTHNYTFTVYALDATVTVPSGIDGDGLINAMKGHIIKETQFVGVYTRWLK